MKHFLTVFYVGLYTIITTSLVIVEVASIKIGWPWLSTLVHPMGILFLAINVPLALIGVAKISHVVYLHSVQHHRNVMRSIRAADAYPPTLVGVTHQQHISEDETVSQSLGTGGTLLSGVSSSQGVPSETHAKNDNVVIAYYLVDHPGASIRDIEKAPKIPRASIGRTNAWKNRGR